MKNKANAKELRARQFVWNKNDLVLIKKGNSPLIENHHKAKAASTLKNS